MVAAMRQIFSRVNWGDVWLGMAIAEAGMLFGFVLRAALQ